jgi:membrane protein implicated in regulation of membrane protease activity
MMKKTRIWGIIGLVLLAILLFLKLSPNSPSALIPQLKGQVLETTKAAITTVILVIIAYVIFITPLPLPVKLLVLAGLVLVALFTFRNLKKEEPKIQNNEDIPK